MDSKYKRNKEERIRYNSSNVCFLNSIPNTCMHVFGLEVTRAGRPLNTKTVLLNTKNNHKPYKKTTDKPISTV